MESNYATLIRDLDAREKHILQLQSELLRVDYEYGVIVKDLKQKYQHISQQFSLNHYALKQSKKQKKRLQATVVDKQRQLQNWKLQVQDLRMKNSYQEEGLKRAKEQNQMLRNQIKFMEANQNKYMVKAQEANRKKDQYKEEIFKLQEKIMHLQKQVKKLNLKRKELEELVQQEVLETHQRIQNIGIQFTTKNNLMETQKQVIDDIYLEQTLKKTLNNIATSPREGQRQMVNDWESDMKKLKNCIDYGSSYMMMFDPMNFDRTHSREIFKFLRKCLKQTEDLCTQLQQLKSVHNTSLASHKITLDRFEQQLQNISREKKNTYTIDSQVQTENPNSLQAQRAAYQLNQLNMKLKIKNTGLVQCVQLMGLRNAILLFLLGNAHKNMQYWKIKCHQQVKQAKPRIKAISKFRSAACSVLFIKLLSKKSSISRQENKKVRVQYLEQKIRTLCLIFQKQCPQNIELLKLKEQVVITHESLKDRCAQIVDYYQFKTKDWMERQSICLPLKI